MQLILIRFKFFPGRGQWTATPFKNEWRKMHVYYEHQHLHNPVAAQNKTGANSRGNVCLSFFINTCKRAEGWGPNLRYLFQVAGVQPCDCHSWKECSIRTAMQRGNMDIHALRVTTWCFHQKALAQENTRGGIRTWQHWAPRIKPDVLGLWLNICD